MIPRSITVIHHGQTDLSCSVQWKVIHFPISTKLMASNSNIEDKPTNYIYIITLSHPHLHKQNKTRTWRSHIDHINFCIQAFSVQYLHNLFSKQKMLIFRKLNIERKQLWKTENTFWYTEEWETDSLSIIFLFAPSASKKEEKILLGNYISPAACADWEYLYHNA